MKTAKFGTAGTGELFKKKGFKKSQEAPAFLESLGLSAFEYQCGRGVRIGERTAKALGEEAVKHHIALSLHAPYYISLVNQDREKVENNLRYFRESAQAAREMGATRVIFHPGGMGKGKTREEAFLVVKDALINIMESLNKEGYQDILFCPETMGKINQMGTLEETLELANVAENMLPCIDIGHLNARTFGEVNSYEAYTELFDQIEKGIGLEKAKNVHIHFSKIEYSKGGEKKHLTFADETFGPFPEPLIKLIKERGYTPTIICESDGTQAEDAQYMAQLYQTDTN